MHESSHAARNILRVRLTSPLYTRQHRLEILRFCDSMASLSGSPDAFGKFFMHVKATHSVDVPLNSLGHENPGGEKSHCQPDLGATGTVSSDIRLDSDEFEAMQMVIMQCCQKAGRHHGHTIDLGMFNRYHASLHHDGSSPQG